MVCLESDLSSQSGGHSSSCSSSTMQKHPREQEASFPHKGKGHRRTDGLHFQVLNTNPHPQASPLPPFSNHPLPLTPTPRLSGTVPREKETMEEGVLKAWMLVVMVQEDPSTRMGALALPFPGVLGRGLKAC